MAVLRFAAALLLTVGIIATTVAAIPRGYSTFFDTSSCPDGWIELNSAQGRLIVSTNTASTAGITVNAPLSDQEDRAHTHAFQTQVVVSHKDVAAIGCCNNQGAQHGAYPVSNASMTSDSGYPFTQLLLCSFQGTNDTDPLAYGAVGYFDPDVTGCPDSWQPMNDANGRILVPSYEQGGVVSNTAPPLASGEDRVHNHSFSINFPVSQVSYAGAGGCCDSGPSDFGPGTLNVAAETNSASAGLPYVQLLTCVNQAPTFNQTLPSGAMAFSAVSCPPGYEPVNEVSGRLLVALPLNGEPGASFGGAQSLDPSGKTNPAHQHGIVGVLSLPSVGVGLASGCCDGGYIAAGSYPYVGLTSADSEYLPYTLLPLCRSQLDKKAAKSVIKPVKIAA